MKSYQRWIWELPEWPSLVFDAHRIQPLLAAAKKSQGSLRSTLPLRLGEGRSTRYYPAIEGWEE